MAVRAAGRRGRSRRARWWLPTLHLVLVLGVLAYALAVTRSPWVVPPLAAVALAALGRPARLPSINVTTRGDRPSPTGE